MIESLSCNLRGPDIHGILIIRTIKMRASFLCVPLMLIQSSAAFLPVTVKTATRQFPHLPRGGDLLTAATTSTSIQNSMIPTVVSSALKSGPWGVLALSGVAASVILPLTMYRQGYSFSVGYGFSVAAMGFTIAKTFGICLATASPLSLLALGVIFYGVRLGSFLLLREFTVESKRQQIKAFDKSPVLQRIPLAISVSIFYAFMTSPLLYAARKAMEDNLLFRIGVAVAWSGAIIEAVTDGQKFLAKRNINDESTFVGPTGGLYRISRHPNYLGELVWWFGLALSGAPSFGKDPIPWVCSILGMYGIYGIMSGAAKRLDGKQQEKYAGQEKYDVYRNEVPATLWPLTKA